MSLICGAIFALVWACKNKRNMKAAYPGPMLNASLPDKPHPMWLHGNTMIKPMHSIAPPPSHLNAEYAEVAPTVISKILSNSDPPEPYATVTLQHGAIQSDDSCIKCSISPSSSEYNAPIREPLNICDVLPPPPDHPYGSYKAPSNMTIRTNPVPMSPHINRRTPQIPQPWDTMSPPMQSYSHNWSEGSARGMMPNANHDYYENEYESGSVLYEQCCRPDEAPNSIFYRGGEPTEEYYRNINMEFLIGQEFEPSTPPPPCPGSHNSTIARAQNNLHTPNSSNNFNHGLQTDLSPIHSRRPSRNFSDNSRNATLSSDERESDNAMRHTRRTRRNRSKSNDRKIQNNSREVNLNRID